MSAQAIRSISLPQGRVAYRESGSGDPILFIHGWLLSSLTWRKVIPALEPSYRCIAVDLIGAGDTEASLDGDFSMPAQARMLAAFIDALELPSVTLIAHDSGGTIARILAADQPQRVPRFVLSDTEIPGHVIRYFSFLQKVLRIPGSARLFEMFLSSRNFLYARRLGFGNAAYDHSALDLDEFFATSTGQVLSSRARLRGCLEFMDQFDWHLVDTLDHDRLTMPKLVLWGDHDAFFPLSKGQQFFETLPGPKSFTTIANCGIFPHEERPAEWLAAVEPFLADTPA